MSKAGKRILKSVRKARAFAAGETSKGVEVPVKEKTFNRLKKRGRRSLSIEQINRIAARGWAGKR